MQNADVIGIVIKIDHRILAALLLIDISSMPGPYFHFGIVIDKITAHNTLDNASGI